MLKSIDYKSSNYEIKNIESSLEYLHRTFVLELY